MRRGLQVCAAAVAAALVVTAVEAPAATPARRARLAVSYLVSQQSDDGSFPGFSPVGSAADAVLAMVAARRAPESIERTVSYLEDNLDAATLGQKAKVVLAAVAVGRDPRSFGGHDLVAEIESSQQPDGQYAAPLDDSSGDVITHVLAMLALAAADRPPAVAGARWLAEAQCDDGGWEYDQPASAGVDEHCFDPAGGEFDARSDTNTTSYAVQALAATPAAPPLDADPFVFFDTARDPLKGGWIYDPTQRCTRRLRPPECFTTDTNSTALVLQAYAAEDRAPPERGDRALRRLQYTLCGPLAGAFAFTWEQRNGKLRRSPPRSDAGGATVVGATIAAVPGLLELPFPLEPAEITRPAPQPRSCD